MRALALALLAWGLVGSLAPRERSAVEEIRGAELASALPRLTMTPPRAGVRLALDTMPGPLARDWLVALRRAGMPVSWTAAQPRPLAVAVEPAVDPRGGAIVRVAAPPGGMVLVGDDAGMLDSARAQLHGVGIHASALAGAADARLDGQHARAHLADSLRLRPVLVLASAGWEGKFVVAALEEEGWAVEARLAVAPGAEVRQGELGAIDTTRYSAVVVLDSTARARGSVLTQYARSGGGLIVAGSAARIPELRGILPGELGAARSPSPSALGDSVSLATLSLAPIARLRDDALVAGRQGGAVSIAVRRLHAGRVALTGYRDSWRWRMSGGEDGVREHRRWWSSLVSAVAYAPPIPRVDAGRSQAALDEELEAAPFARSTGALGAMSLPSAATPARIASSWWPSGVPWWTSVILVLAFLAEWSSRRLRGAR